MIRMIFSQGFATTCRRSKSWTSMSANAGPYAGLDRYAARKKVLEDLREQGFLVGEKDYTVALGKCDRCGTVVEPRLSMQWFIKIAPLAAKAAEVVESGEITIVPENYKTDRKRTG